ncbi:hypothetical protein B484DRAFT_395434, partial [Ochromonadaceae sp. CCMP2298]
MSFSSLISKYPAAGGYLKEAMALLSEAPAALSDTNCEVVATAAVPDGTIFLLPLLDTALALLPPCTQLLTYGQLILLLKGKHRKTETEYDLVCNIVGGAQLAEAQLTERQTGITFRKVGNVWSCTDKRGAQLKLQRIMATCMALFATGEKHPAEHPDAGLHLYSALRPLTVMKTGFGEESKFQAALMLRFDSLDHSKMSVMDFQEPDKGEPATLFERDRYSTAMRCKLRNALEFVETLFQAFSHPDFGGTLQPLTNSLNKDTSLWNRFQDPFLLFRVSLMLQRFSEEVRSQKTCTVDNAISLATGKGCAALLRALATSTVGHAVALTDGWTEGTHEHGLYWAIKQRATPAPSAGGELKRGREGDTPIPDTKPINAAGSSAAAKAATAAAALLKGPKSILHCVHHVMGKLGVKDESGKTAGCGKSSVECKYRHTDVLSSLTKEQALQCTQVKLSDPALASNFLKAVKAKTDWKSPAPEGEDGHKGPGSAGRGPTPSNKPTSAPPTEPCLSDRSTEGKDVARRRPPASQGDRTAVQLHTPPQGRVVRRVGLPADEGDQPAGTEPPAGWTRPATGQPWSNPLTQPCPMDADAADAAGDSSSGWEEGVLYPVRDLCVIDTLRARMNVLFPASRSAISHGSALALIERAYKANHFDSNLDIAIAAVGLFAFDEAALQRDSRAFDECGGDLVELARRRIDARRPERFNVGRVEACISRDDPERARLLQFLQYGVDPRPLLPPEF